MNVKIAVFNILFLFFYLEIPKQAKPVLYLIGDSTVATSSPKSAIQGWGGKLTTFFDSTKLDVQNRSVSGISSRTYQTAIVHDQSMLKNGMWKGVMEKLKAGDFVMMQFGHNDESPIVDTLRMRGTIKGIGNDSAMVFNHFLKRNEIVYTYGYYLRKIVSDIKSRGAIALICSPIPKNKWIDGRVVRNSENYGKWTKQVAEQSDTFFIDLNQLVADEYDRQGQEKVSSLYFVPDGVHTTQAGALLNAQIIINAIKKNKKLKPYLNI